MSKYFAFAGLPGSFVLTMLMSLFAIILALIDCTAARWLCCIAMIFSTVGDIFLMDFRDLSRKFPNYFLIGASFFIVAHLFYAGAFAYLIRQNGYRLTNGAFWAAVVLSGVVLICFLIRRTNTAMMGLLFAYLTVITVNCSLVFSYTQSSFAHSPLVILGAIGALSFYLSDLIIGLEKFMGISRFGFLIWWLYPIGQILLLGAPKGIYSKSVR